MYKLFNFVMYIYIAMQKKKYAKIFCGRFCWDIFYKNSSKNMINQVV